MKSVELSCSSIATIVIGIGASIINVISDVRLPEYILLHIAGAQYRSILRLVVVDQRTRLLCGIGVAVGIAARFADEEVGEIL